jgi:transposase
MCPSSLEVRRLKPKEDVPSSVELRWRPDDHQATFTRHIIRTRLDSFYQHAAATEAPEAHRLAATIEAWWPAIEAGLLGGYSNSRSEGYNRLAKHEGRNAFGFRNPVNQRRRIRWSCTRNYRRASAVISTLPG